MNLDQDTFGVGGFSVSELFFGAQGGAVSKKISDFTDFLFDAQSASMFKDAGKTQPVTVQGDAIARAVGQTYEYEASGSPTYNGIGALDSTSGCIQTVNTVPVAVNDRTWFAIVRVDSAHTGYIMSSDSGSNGISMRTDGNGIIEVFHEGGTDKPIAVNIPAGYVLGTPFVLTWRQTTSGGGVFVDDVSVRELAQGGDALGTSLKVGIGGRPGGASLFNGLVYMAGQATDIDDEQFATLQSLLMKRLAEIKAIRLELTTPDKTVFQTDSNNADRATIRARGIWTGSGAPEVQYAGGGWQTTTVSGGTFSYDFTDVERGEGTLEVRALGGALTDSNTVGAGDNIGVYSQSNGLGSADNVQSYVGAILGAFRNPSDAVPVDPLGTSDKSWHPNFLTHYTDATGRRVNLHIEGRGSTPGFAFEEGAAPYAGAETSLWDRFYRLIVSSQMLDPDTYDPAVDGPVCLCVFYWQGETDTNIGTSTVSYEATLRSIASSTDTKLDAPLLVPVLQILDPSYATTQRQADIRTAQRNVRGDNAPGVAGHLNVLPGPDWSGTSFDTSNGVHIANDANQAARAAEISVSVQAV
jgi:hypothetical protein